MCRRWTPSDCPFPRGIRVHYAIFDSRIFNTLTTSFTLVSDRMTTASIEITSFFSHKDALITFLDGLAKHGNHPLFFIEYIGQKKADRRVADAPIIANVPNKLGRYLTDKIYRVNKKIIPP